MREEVVVVEDDRLNAPWAVAQSNDGRRAVFVRDGSQHLLDQYCRLGPGSCPIWMILTAKEAAA